MKWLEKNWVIVAVVTVGYLWFNGSLKNLLGTSSTTPVSTGTGTTILGG